MKPKSLGEIMGVAWRRCVGSHSLVMPLWASELHKPMFGVSVSACSVHPTRALGGGIPGAIAGAVQVILLMWLR